MPDTAASRKRQIACCRYLRSGCEHRRRRRAGLVRHLRQTIIDNNKVCWPHPEFHGGQNPGRESPKRAGLALLSSLPLYKGCRHTIRLMPGEVIPRWARREADSINERLDSR